MTDQPTSHADELTIPKAEAAPASPPKPAAPKPIDPRAVTFNSKGFAWNEVLVRLPRGMVFGDLIEPSIWRNVQSDRNSNLKKLDRVSIVDYDETWLATAIVSAASAIGLTLSKPVKIDLQPRTERLFETELYRIVWVGGGYRTERKTDRQFVTELAASLEIAERDLRSLYPKPVS